MSTNLPAPRPVKQGKVREIKPIDPPELDWTPDHAAASLRLVAEHVGAEAKNAIQWYLDNKVWKKRLARITRGLVIFLLACAAILPLVVQLTGGPTIWWAQPAWASLLVAIAAALIGVDRFFGFSGGWMRFVVAHMQLTQALKDFEMDWEALSAALAGEKPTPAQIAERLARCKVFMLRVKGIVQDETNTWITEFRSTIQQIDDATKLAEQTAKAAATAGRPGAINVTVRNGTQAKDGWSISVDDGSPVAFQGTTGSVVALAGMHTVTCTATVDSSPRRLATAVTVPAGGIATVSFDL